MKEESKIKASALSLSILVGLMIFFLISSVGAIIDSFGVGQQHKNMDLALPCSNETAVCTFCNITSIKNIVDSNVIVSNVVMTKRNAEFNYTLTNTSLIGEYSVNGICGDGNNIKTFSYGLTITPNGTSLSVSQGILYFIFLIASIGLFILCLTYAIKIPWQHQRDEENNVIGINDLKYLKLFLIVACYLILLLTFGLLRGITANYVPEVGVSGLFEWAYWIMLSLMYPLIVCSLIFGLIIWIQNKKFMKAITRGFPIEK